MELQKVRNSKGEIMVEPVHKKDVEVFSHCAYGHIWFPSRLYASDLKPLLLAHNVGHISIVDRAGKNPKPTGLASPDQSEHK